MVPIAGERQPSNTGVEGIGNRPFISLQVWVQSEVSLEVVGHTTVLELQALAEDGGIRRDATSVTISQMQRLFKGESGV